MFVVVFTCLSASLWRDLYYCGKREWRWQRTCKLSMNRFRHSIWVRKSNWKFKLNSYEWVKLINDFNSAHLPHIHPIIFVVLPYFTFDVIYYLPSFTLFPRILSKILKFFGDNHLKSKTYSTPHHTNAYFIESINKIQLKYIICVFYDDSKCLLVGNKMQPII